MQHISHMSQCIPDTYIVNSKFRSKIHSLVLYTEYNAHCAVVPSTLSSSKTRLIVNSSQPYSSTVWSHCMMQELHSTCKCITVVVGLLSKCNVEGKRSLMRSNPLWPPGPSGYIPPIVIILLLMLWIFAAPKIPSPCWFSMLAGCLLRSLNTQPK